MRRRHDEKQRDKDKAQPDIESRRSKVIDEAEIFESLVEAKLGGSVVVWGAYWPCLAGHPALTSFPLRAPAFFHVA